ncbi:MAG: iron complex outermembrane receptor protein [Bermanella sp.]|jgi:iron complex outermembrane receptor protein
MNKTSLHALTFSLLFLSAGADAQTDPTDKKATRGTLEEVVVTARRRAENLQETPIAVTSLSGDALREQGITNTADLTKSIPSLQINSPYSNQIYIRGIGERTGRTRVDPTVGVYLDGIYLPRPDGQLLDTVDVQSIQVLRGPQGTLFGKNTTAGAMVLTLEKPHDTFEGYVEAGIGSYEQRDIKIGLNMPVTDTLFTRLAVHTLKDDGFLKDVSGIRTAADDRKSLLFQTRWDASDDVVVDGLLFASKTREVFPGTNCTLINEDKALFASGIYLMWPGDTDPSSPRAFRENCEANSRDQLGDLKTNLGPAPLIYSDYDAYMLAGTIEWPLDDRRTVKAIAGYREETEGRSSSSDSDGGPKRLGASYQPDDSDRQSASFELQLNGSAWNDRVNYTAGAFYMWEHYQEPLMTYTSVIGLDSTSVVSLAAGRIPERPPVGGTVPFVGVLSGPLLLSEFELENQTAAAFIQASWDITDSVQVTAGLRYTIEDRQSELLTTPGDVAVTIARIESHPLFGTPVPIIPGGAGGFVPYLGPLRWLDDPVSIAAGLFTDPDGDGILDYPLDYNNQSFDERSETFSELTPMVSASYIFPYESLQNTVLDTTMVYGTWSNGFKSGFFEPRGVDGLSLVEPEEVENLEVGIKMDAFDRSVRLNIAVYQMDFKNMQLIQVQTDSESNLAVIFSNAGRSQVNGAEMELSWLPTPEWMLTFNYSNNNYKFLEYKDLALTPIAIEGRREVVDRSDEGFPVSPEKTAALGIQYSWDSDVGLITPRLDVSYKSDSFQGIDDASWDVYREDVNKAGQEAFTLVDFRISWTNLEGDTSIAFSAKNLTDQRYSVGPAAVADSLGNYAETYGDPRWTSLDFRKTF